MKKIIFILLAISLISCGKLPQEKYDLAKHCLDSLENNGAKNCVAYYDLLDNMKYTDGQIEVQESKLFKKYDDVNKGLDEIINLARTFTITYDRPADVEKARRGVPNDSPSDNTVFATVNPNSVTIEVVITSDDKPDPLDIASRVDQAIRRDINAKLISVKIKE